ncbi:MAG TPA: flagellar basal body rod protein FlgB [Xanthobacteraceae bacterium]
MPISDIPIFAMLRTKLQWHQERQHVLAENVANAETPEFKPSDLAPPSYGTGAPGVAPVALVRTSPAHLASAEGASQFDLRPGHDFEVVPTGNGVVLEDEMMKVAANQMDFQAATALYARGLGLIKTAIGR